MWFDRGQLILVHLNVCRANDVTCVIQVGTGRQYFCRVRGSTMLGVVPSSAFFEVGDSIRPSLLIA